MKRILNLGNYSLLNRNLLLGVHMARSGKHFDVFNIIYKEKAKTIDEVNEKLNHTLSTNGTVLHVRDPHNKTGLTFIITPDYIRYKNILHIPVQLGYKYRYLCYELDQQPEEDLNKVVRIAPDEIVSGMITPEKSIIVHTGEGRISFLTKKQKQEVNNNESTKSD